MSSAPTSTTPAAQKGEKITVKTVGKSILLNPGSNPKEYVTKLTAANGKIYPLKTATKDPTFSKK